jgi:hypothetical protein
MDWDAALAWFNQNSSAVEAAATVLAALIAAGALVSTAFDSSRRSRPLITAEHRLAPHSDTSIQLVVKNYGQSAGRSMKVKFDPELTNDSDTRDVRLRYGSMIPWLNPGQELVNTWLIPKYDNRSQYEGNVYSFPDKVEVTVTYWGGWFRYKNKIDLDVNLYIHSSSSVSSSSMLGSIQGIRNQMKKIADTTKAIADSLPDPDEPPAGTQTKLRWWQLFLGPR